MDSENTKVDYKETLKYELSKIYYGFQNELKKQYSERAFTLKQLDDIEESIKRLKDLIEEFKGRWRLMYPEVALEISDLGNAPVMSEEAFSKKLGS